LLEFISENFFNDNGTYTGGRGVTLSRVMSSLRHINFAEDFDKFCSIIAASNLAIASKVPLNLTCSYKLVRNIQSVLPNIDQNCFSKFYGMIEAVEKYLASKEVLLLFAYLSIL